MKIIRSLSFILLLIDAYGQNVAAFGPEISVGDGSVYGNLRPRMALTNDGPVVLLSKGGGGALSVAKWNGTAFDTPVNILPAGMETYASTWTGADIAATGNTVIVTFKATPVETAHVYAVRSTDGGVTFGDTVRVDSHETGIAWMPSLDMDANGNPTVTFMIHDANWTNPRYAIARSTDAGVSFLPQQEITGNIPGEACDCCPAEVAIDGDRQVMLFRNNESNVRDIFGVLSQDAGSSFTSEANIDNTNWVINACPSTGPSGSFVNSTLFTTYASRATGEYRVYVTRSDASTSLTYTDRLPILESEINTSSQNFPRLHSWGDTVVVAWQENKGSNADIYVSIATNEGVDMLTDLSQNPFIANETTTGVQSYPDVRINGDMVHLCYVDAISGDVLYRRGNISELSLEESALSGDLTVYPNPSTTGTFGLEGTALIEIVITDKTGKQIEFTTTKPGQITLNASPGVYFLNGVNENGVNVFRKLVIK